MMGGASQVRSDDLFANKFMLINHQSSLHRSTATALRTRVPTSISVMISDLTSTSSMPYRILM